MTDILVDGAPTPEWFSVLGSQSVGYGCLGGDTNPFASRAWPANNRAIFVPFYIPKPTRVSRTFVVNGATASGNIDFGIYRADTTTTATQLCSAYVTNSSVNVAQAGTTALQFSDVTDFILQRGMYYFACSKDDTTGTVHANATNIEGMQAAGMASMESAYPLPTTATLVLLASAYAPLIGFSSRSGL